VYKEFDFSFFKNGWAGFTSFLPALTFYPLGGVSFFGLFEVPPFAPFHGDLPRDVPVAPFSFTLFPLASSSKELPSPCLWSGLTALQSISLVEDTANTFSPKGLQSCTWCRKDSLPHPNLHLPSLLIRHSFPFFPGRDRDGTTPPLAIQSSLRSPSLESCLACGPAFSLFSEGFPPHSAGAGHPPRLSPSLWAFCFLKATRLS